MEQQILLVDDDENIRETLGVVLREEGYDIISASNGKEAVEQNNRNEFTLLITDLKLPDVDGVELYETIRKTHPETLAIIITAHAGFESAIRAMRLGAYDYIQKPFRMEEILLTVKRALQHAELLSQNVYLRRELKDKYHPDNIVGTSLGMQKVYELMRKVADSDATVLIYGESGTGKELAARAIHHMSKRANQKFVPLSCGALPETLLESELFGYEKGAFTGALSRKPGLFEIADGGTVFLDEVGDLSAGTQIKLLRVLQEREFQPIGGVKQIKVDVRLISATNKDIESAAKEGKFREDLYYRLNVVAIELPPLNERKDDIPLLVNHFLKKFGSSQKVSKETANLFADYFWPGNVRELENVIERAVVLGTGDCITPGDLPERLQKEPLHGNVTSIVPTDTEGANAAHLSSLPSLRGTKSNVIARSEFHHPSLRGTESRSNLITGSGQSLDFRKAREEFEKQFLGNVLDMCNGNVSEAARKSGISRRYFYQKIK